MLKHTIHYLFLLSIGFCGMGHALNAQTIRTYLAQSTIRMDQRMELYVEVTGFVAKIQPEFPALESFRKGEIAELAGHTTGDGPVTTYVQSYQPLDTGTFIIPSFKVKMDEKNGLSQELEVKILPGPPASSFVDEPLDAWVRASFSSERCYVGQQVRMDLKLYLRESHRNLLQVNDIAQARLREGIAHQGFWVEKPKELPKIPQKIQQDGHDYLVYTLYQAFLFPLNPGTYHFDTLYLEASRREIKKGASTFEVLSGKGSRYVPTLMPFNPISLTVANLPAEAQSIQSVGKFDFQAALSHETLSTGQSIELLVTLSGTGNMALLKAPILPKNPSFSYQEARTTYEVTFTDQEVIGKKYFRYEIRSAFSGGFDLGPLAFHFFDPLTARSDSLYISELPLRVQGEDKPEILKDPLDSFYRTALAQASTQPRFSLPGAPYWALGLTILALGLLVWLQVKND